MLKMACAARWSKNSPKSVCPDYLRTMKPASAGQTASVSESISRAAAIVDPANHDPLIPELLISFEDDTRPASSVEQFDEELLSTVEALDPEATSGALAMVAAVAYWLGGNMGGTRPREQTLREAARLVYRDERPNHVEMWLISQNVEA
jgi:hypothetical protein